MTQKIRLDEAPAEDRMEDFFKLLLGPNLKLPAPDLVSYYALEKDRKLYLDFKVSDPVLAIQRLILRWNMEDSGMSPEERKPIRLYIFSPGGDIDFMWSLVDTIEASETPVYTINVGVTGSAAGVIYLAGHKRYMLNHSRLIIHEGSATMSGDAVKVMDAGENYKRMIKQMKDFILRRTTITPAFLNRQRCHDWELDAADCMKYGACEQVVKNLREII